MGNDEPSAVARSCPVVRRGDPHFDSSDLHVRYLPHPQIGGRAVPLHRRGIVDDGLSEKELKAMQKFTRNLLIPERFR
jgi:hypothetical protein